MISNSIYRKLTTIMAGAVFAASCQQTNNQSRESMASPVESDSPDTVYSFQGFHESDSIKPFWMESPDSLEYAIDSISFDEVSFGGSKILLDVDEYTSAFSNPLEVTEVGEVVSCRGNSYELDFKNYFFPSFKFMGIHDHFLLSNIDLRVPSLHFSLGDLRIDSTFSLSTFSKHFPNSYNWRNRGTNWTFSLLDESQQKSFNFFVIKDTKTNSSLIISYADNKPFFLEFSWDCELLVDF